MKSRRSIRFAWLFCASCALGGGAALFVDEEAPAPRVAAPRASTAREPARVPARRVRTLLGGADGRPSIVAPTDEASAPVAAGTPPLEAARAHLRSIAGAYGLDEADLSTLVHRDTLAAGAEGARIVRFTQRLEGTPILGREVAVLMDGASRLVTVSGHVTPSTVLARGRTTRLRARTSADDALASAHRDALGARGTILRSDVRPMLVEEEGTLVPAHRVMLERGAVPPEDSAMVALVSAIDGRVLRTIRLAHADEFSYRVFGDTTPPFVPWDSPTGSGATPHPTGTPDGFQPPLLPPALVTLQNAPFSRNDAWLPSGSVSLDGNLARATAVLTAAPEDDVVVSPTAPGVFDRSFLGGVSPTASAEQSQAATTHLFYVASWLHDAFYDAGFDELAGNAQADDFGRGGIGGDALVLEAQSLELEGRSLAVIPPDGQTPRLSFGLYPGAPVARDGALDTSLVAHEWGHLLSERLVGDGLGLANGQGRAIGEGTSDFVSLLTIVRPEDINVPANANWNGAFAIGGYVASADDVDGHYYGLRRAPYSADLWKNALTLAHVVRGTALPSTHAARGGSPMLDANAHEAGELWAAALWECYVSLLRAHPFQEAQDRIRHYLVHALAIMPSSPTFAEASASLLAVAGANDPADRMRFAAALARRGLGFGTVTAPSTSTDFVGMEPSDRTSLALHATITLDDSVTPCDGDGVLDEGEVGLLTVELENVGGYDLAAFSVTVTSTGNATASFPAGSTLSFGAMPVGTRLTQTLQVELTDASAASPAIGLTLATDVPGPAADTTFTFARDVDYDEALGATSDAFDTRLSTLHLVDDAGVVSPLPATTTRGFAHLDDGPSEGVVALVTSPLDVTGELAISYRTRHSLVLDENADAPIDGARVEISEDGVHFVDVASLGAEPGYAGSLDATSALGAGPALVGMSAGFPAFAPRVLALGGGFVGKTVVLRFRVAARGGARSAYGLDVDDLVVTGVAGTPFVTRVPEPAAQTCDRAPIADAGADQAVSERSGDPMSGPPTVVTLSAAGSSDPDADPLTFTWTQLSKPFVTLSDASSASPTFDAPDVPRDTMLVFRVTVSDGATTSFDDVRVTVRHDNVAPVASLTGPASVHAGLAAVLLDGSGSSDPDGDPLTYTFTQTSGPTVALVVAGPVASFAAPTVSTDTTLGFSLVVSDGVASSVAATHAITVTPEVEETDAGVTNDAGVDASVEPMGDAGVEPTTDAGTHGVGGGGGCTVSRGAASEAWLTLASLVLVLSRRRRGR